MTPPRPSPPLLAVAAAGPVTIADGHHRYETALRYRDERRMSRSCEEDPAFDYLLTLLIDAVAEPLTVLPTHRLRPQPRRRGRRAPARRSRARSSRSDATSPRDELRRRFEAIATEPGGAGRFGLWTRSGGAILIARRHAFEPWLPAGGDALRGLDVTLLGVALERLAGIDAEALAAGAVAYTKSADEALDAVDAGRDGADAAFLLEPTPVASILAVAARRRRHAPEVDLLLSQGPDRPGHQPARMVNLHARHHA